MSIARIHLVGEAIDKVIAIGQVFNALLPYIDVWVVFGLAHHVCDMVVGTICPAVGLHGKFEVNNGKAPTLLAGI